MFEEIKKIKADVSGRTEAVLMKMAHFAPNLTRLLKNKSGIGAVEFSLLAPVLLLLYFSTFELTVAFTVFGRVSRASSTIADLIASQTQVDKNYLGTMPDVMASIMAPYTAADATTLKMSGIKLDGAAKATIDWSMDKNKGKPYTVGSNTTVPDDLKVANTYLIRSELVVPYSTLVYIPGMAYSKLSSMTFTKVYYFAPRLGANVPCTDC